VPDFLLSFFGFLQVDDDILIVNEVSLGGGQALQNTIVNLFHFLLIITFVFDELILAVFELHLHPLDDYTGQLLFKTLFLDCEVDQNNFGCNLRLVFGIGKLSSHE
jgi:hypothetical protein